MKTLRLSTVLISILTLGAAGAAAQATPAAPPAATTPNTHLDVRQVKIPDQPPAPKSEVLDVKGMKGDLDHSALESPVAGSGQGPERGRPVFEEAAVSVRLDETLTSGSQRNGDTVHGTLAAPLKARNGSTLPVGTKVEGTVVSSARAGVIGSGGVLTLQLTRIAGAGVVSDVVEVDGKSAQQTGAYGVAHKGVEARVDSGSKLEFHLMAAGDRDKVLP